MLSIRYWKLIEKYRTLQRAIRGQPSVERAFIRIHHHRQPRNRLGTSRTTFTTAFDTVRSHCEDHCHSDRPPRRPAHPIGISRRGRLLPALVSCTSFVGISRLASLHLASLGESWANSFLSIEALLGFQAVKSTPATNDQSRLGGHLI